MTADLTPTEELILDVLAARHELDQTIWSFPLRLSQAAASLQDKGYIWITPGVMENTFQASLTERYKLHVLSGGYKQRPPVQREYPRHKTPKGRR